GVIALVNFFLYFARQPAIEFRAQYYHSGVGCLAEMAGLEVHRKRGLVVYEGEPPVIDEAFPSGVFLFPVFGYKLRQVAAPEYAAGNIFRSRKFSLFN